MKDYQKELIDAYESLTGLDVLNKENITDDASFWVVWDANKRWFDDMHASVMVLDSPLSVHRPEKS
jgi:hypothetical protein